MKLIPLTKGRFAKVDDEDFDRVSKFNWCLLSPPNNHTQYAARREPKSRTRMILLHREILGNPADDVDHRNGDGLDCQRDNLRVATDSQNMGNSRRRRDNRSGFKGVCWYPAYRKWTAEIQVNKKRFRLGYFASAEEAARAYDTAARKYFGEFARLNFP